MMKHDQFVGHNGCQICGGEGKTFAVPCSAGLITLCVADREQLDLVFLDRPSFREAAKASDELELQTLRLRAGQDCREEYRQAAQRYQICRTEYFSDLMDWVQDRRGDIAKKRAAARDDTEPAVTRSVGHGPQE